MFWKNIEDDDLNDEELSYKSVNDIYFEEDKEDLDISSIFLIKQIQPIHKLRKTNLEDIKTNLKDIWLWVKYKIKLFKLKNKILDLSKNKKKTAIKLSNYNPKIDENTINIIDIEQYNKQNETLYSDIHSPLYNTNFIIKKFFKNIKKIDIKFFKPKFGYIKFLKYLSIFLLVITSYLTISFFEVKYTISTFNNFKFDNLLILKKDIKNIKNHVYITNLLLTPIYFINNFVNNSDIKSLNTLLKASTYAFNWAINWIDLYEDIKNNYSPNTISWQALWDFISNNYKKIWSINSDLEKTISYLETIKKINNPKYDKILKEKLLLLKNINSYSKYIYSNLDLFLDIIWWNSKKTYLIAFQNSDELRPTWWFIWSVWIIDLYKWKVLKFEKKDIYKIEFDIWTDKFKQKAPEWLNEISKFFALRDGNYYADLASSSDKIKSFLSKTDYEIDGIIYINQNIILDALEIFWSVYFDKIWIEITKDNFSEIISVLVESKISKTSKIDSPKNILFDFINLFIVKLQNDLDYKKYLKLAYNSIEKKDILIHFFNDNQNKLLIDMWLQKSYYLVWKDFTFPVFTSISWNKSDRYMKRIFEKNIKKIDNCNLETTFKITQKHTFSINDELQIKNDLYNMNLLDRVNLEQLLEIQWKSKNRQYIRIYIPKNATINSSSTQIKQKELDDKKEVSFYLDTQKLSTSNFEMSYTLPYLWCGDYNFIFIKQPWIKTYEFNFYENGNLINNWLYDRDYYY